MSKIGLDNRHRDKDGEISHKHGNTLIQTLRKAARRRRSKRDCPTEDRSDQDIK